GRGTRSVRRESTAAAQEIDRLGLRVLLAREALDEASAADLAAELEQAVVAHEVAPRHGDALAIEELAEDDAVAVEEAVRYEGDLLFARRSRRRVIVAEARPAAGGGERGLRHRPLALAGGREETTQTAERVARHAAVADELRQAHLEVI